mgnify:CR=1 FL=1
MFKTRCLLCEAPVGYFPENLCTFLSQTRLILIGGTAGIQVEKRLTNHTTDHKAKDPFHNNYNGHTLHPEKLDSKKFGYLACGR